MKKRKEGLTMRKLMLIVAAIAIAAPALATVDIGVSDLGGGQAAITYTCTAGEAVRAFALDITVDTGTIDAVSGFKTGESVSGSLGYGIFPGNFRDYINPATPNWGDPNYTPIAPSGDPDALGGLGTGGVTIELGSLYVDANAPAASGTLCILDISDTALMCVTLNTSRGGVVLEDATAAPTNTLPVCETIVAGNPPPACWAAPLGASQCHADVTGDLAVNTSDWPAFRDSFGKTYPDAAYNPCGDYNRDGTVNTSDSPAFRDNFGKSVAADCALGGTWPPL
jgi:hypothetical protein